MTTINMNDEVKAAFDALQIGDILNDVFKSIEFVEEAPKIGHICSISAKYINALGDYDLPTCSMFCGCRTAMKPSQFIDGVIKEMVEIVERELEDYESIDDYKDGHSGPEYSIDDYIKYSINDYKDHHGGPEYYPFTIHAMGKEKYEKRMIKRFGTELMYQPKDLYIVVSPMFIKNERRIVKFVCKQDITIGLTYYANFLAFQLLHIIKVPDILEPGVAHHPGGVDIKCDMQQAFCKYGCES